MRRVLVLVLLVGCHDKADTGAVSEGDAEVLCTRGCSYDIDCLGADVDTCIADCIDSAAGWVRHDALEAEQNCIADLPCDEDPGTCGSRVRPLDEHRAFADKCDAQLAECSSLIDCTVEFDPEDPSAGFLRFAAPSVIAELSACLDGADCTARLDCVTAVFDTYGI
jgi:hypothetical protein